MEEITVIKVEAQGWPTLPGYVHCTFLAKVGLLKSGRRPWSWVYEKDIDFFLVSPSLCSAWWLWPRRVYLSDRKAVKKFQRTAERSSSGVKAGKRAPATGLCLQGTPFLSPMSMY